MSELPSKPSPWAALKAHTAARIALGRAGTGLPTRAHLDFQLAHARARDAVHGTLDVEVLQQTLSEAGHEVALVTSAAPDRQTYLTRPDLGRTLAAEGEAVLASYAAKGPFDLVFVLADGLSARAVAENALPFLAAACRLLEGQGWRLAPVVIATQARVALGDAVAAALSARMVVVLVGERPGLSAADSLGVYLTHAPQPGVTRDAERNCISNVRPGGLSHAEAAATLAYLATEARRLGLTGVGLKDDRPLVDRLSAPTA